MTNLLLTRRVGQSIMIGDNVRIKITRQLSDRKVQVLIEAPPEVRIMREEIAEALGDGKADAGESTKLTEDDR